jgi:hypothetical protein
MCTSSVVYPNIASVVASCNTNNSFFGAEIFNPQKKKSAKIKCLLFRPKLQKFHTAGITGYMVFIMHNDHTYITEDYTSLCLKIICNQ